VVKPSEDWGLEFMTAGISDQSGMIMDLIRHHTDMIAQNILAQFLLLGSGGNSGSYALSEDQSGFFTLGLRSVSKHLAQTVNKQAIKELIDLNYGPQEEYPSLDFTKIGEIDYTELSNALSTLSNANLLQFGPKEKVWLAKTMGLPDVTIEEIEEKDEEDRMKRDQVIKQKELERSSYYRAQDLKPQDVDAPDEEELMVKKKTLAEGKRQTTLAEGRVKFSEISSYFDTANQRADAYLSRITDQQLEESLIYMEQALQIGNSEAVRAYTVPKSQQMKSELKGLAQESMDYGASQASQELNLSAPQISNDQAIAFDALLSEKIDSRNAVIQKKVREIGLNSILAGIGVVAAISAISEVFTSSASTGNMGLNSFVSGGALNLGRYSVFNAHHSELHGLQRSEILDPVTCPMCLSIDGRVIDSRDVFGRLGDVHTNCRGLWVGVLKTDSELPKVAGIPKSIENKFDTIEGVPITDSFTQPSKAIYNKDSRVNQAVGDGELDDNPGIK